MNISKIYLFSSSGIKQVLHQRPHYDHQRQRRLPSTTKTSPAGQRQAVWSGAGPSHRCYSQCWRWQWGSGCTWTSHSWALRRRPYTPSPPWMPHPVPAACSTPSAFCPLKVGYGLVFTPIWYISSSLLKRCWVQLVHTLNLFPSEGWVWISVYSPVMHLITFT